MIADSESASQPAPLTIRGKTAAAVPAAQDDVETPMIIISRLQGCAEMSRLKRRSAENLTRHRQTLSMLIDLAQMNTGNQRALRSVAGAISGELQEIEHMHHNLRVIHSNWGKSQCESVIATVLSLT